MVKEWFVWSSGSERWERIHPTADDIKSFVYQHSKIVNGQPVTVYIDATGRYVGGFRS